MKVMEIMRKPVATLPPEVTVTAAIARMRELGVSALPVEDQDSILLGIVALTDLSRRLPEARGDSSDSVGHCLSSHLVTATSEMDVGRLAEMMRYKGLDAIMVVEGRCLVGAVSLDEATRAAAKAAG